MSANPHANGGLLLRELRLPDFRDYAVKVSEPGAAMAESTRIMGRFLRDVMKLNMEQRNFRLFKSRRHHRLRRLQPGALRARAHLVCNRGRLPLEPKNRLA
jgi:hypothetical protein